MRHGDYLTVAVVIYDPAYLKEPFIRTTDFVAAPQQQIDPYPAKPSKRSTAPSALCRTTCPARILS